MTEPDIVRLIDHLKHCDGRQRNIEVNTFDNAIEAIEQLRKERDEARAELAARPYATTTTIRALFKEIRQARLDRDHARGTEGEK